MKIDFVDVSETQKNLVVEIDSNVVDAEIDKVARDYSKAARIPGFRPGKVPAKVVQQRFRDQILHDVAHGLIPRAVDEALRERGVEPVDTPDISDVVVEEGQPLKFTATFETVPPIEPATTPRLTVHRKKPHVEDADLDQALSQLRERGARYEPIEDRGVELGDSVLMDLVRTAEKKTDEPRIVMTDEERTAAETETDNHHNVTVDIGGQANPPGFDEELARPYRHRPEDVRRQLSRGLHDQGAGRDDGEVRRGDQGDPEADRAGAGRRVRQGPRRLRLAGRAEGRGYARTSSTRRSTKRSGSCARELLKQLATRVHVRGAAGAAGAGDRSARRGVRAAADRSADRPDEDEHQLGGLPREAARGGGGSGRGALVLDEVARRENVGVTTREIEAEISRYAERTGRTPAAVRARLEKEGGIGPSLHGVAPGAGD